MYYLILSLVIVFLSVTPALAVKTITQVNIAPKVKVAPVDTTTPNIIITSPDVSRSLKIMAKTTEMSVTGRAVDESGVASVTVNGEVASLDENGNFSADILLKVGENGIVVTATDIYKNVKTQRFAVVRQVEKTTQKVKREVAPASPVPLDMLSAKYYGLFIAVEDYASNEINRLDYPVADAQRIREILTANYTFDPENVVFLQNPSRKEILRAFEDPRRQVTPQDNLLVFYAGHGVWMDDMKQGYWLPRDASGYNDPSDWIPNSNIRDYIRAIKARHVLLVADACFSGGIFKVRSAFTGPKAAISKIYEMPSRKAITSGALKTVPDRSVFVEYLAKRLHDNQEPYLDSQKLFVSFKEAVINNSPNNQTPLYGAINEAGDEGGDFVFVKRR